MQLNIFSVNNVQQLQQQTEAFKSASTYLAWLTPNLKKKKKKEMKAARRRDPAQK